MQVAGSVKAMPLPRAQLERGFLALLKARPHIDTDLARSLQEVCAQTALRVPVWTEQAFWRLGQQFFAAVVRESAGPWLPWHTLVGAQLLSTLQQIVPTHPADALPLDGMEHLKGFFLELVHMVETGFNMGLSLWSHNPSDSAMLAQAEEAGGSLHALVQAMGLKDLQRLTAHLMTALQTELSQPGSVLPQVLMDGSQELHRLLHQYAAGFEPAPHEGVLRALTNHAIS